MRNLIRRLFKFPADLKPNQMVVEVDLSRPGVCLFARKDSDDKCLDLLNNVLAAGSINLPRDYRDKLSTKPLWKPTA